MKVKLAGGLLALMVLGLTACTPSKPAFEAQESIFTSARKGDQKQVEKYLQGGVSVDTTDPQGRTALHHAAMGGQKEVIEALITAGADVNVQDADGKTPLQLAHEAGYDAAAEVIALRGGA